MADEEKDSRKRPTLVMSRPSSPPTSPPSVPSVPVSIGSLGRSPVVGGAAAEEALPKTSASLRPDYLPQGHVLRGWSIVQKLGAGGMGAVYLVRLNDVEPPEYAALKLSLPPSGDESAEQRHDRVERFRREFAAVFALHHPNIVKPSEFFTWPSKDGHPCIVMPYIEGDTLSAYFRREHPTLRATLSQLLRPIADSVDYIHSKGIRHRDIKPANIMVRRLDGQPLLMDFGIARTAGSATLTTTEMLTTFEYCAPEYLAYIGSVERSADLPFLYREEADLFCLGATFFDICTGYLPYAHVDGVRDPMQYVSPRFQRNLGRFSPLSARSLNQAIPEGLDVLLSRMMAGDPTERFATGGEVVEAIDALLAGLPQHADEWDSPFIPPPKQRGTSPDGKSASRPPASRTKAEGSQPRSGGARSVEVPVLSNAVSLPSVPVASVAAAAGVDPDASADFRPPTAAEKVGFQSVIAVAPASPVVGNAEPELPAALLAAQKQLQAASSGEGRQKVVVLALAAAVTVLLVLVVASMGAPQATAPSQSLLDEKEVPQPNAAARAPMNPLVLAQPTNDSALEPVEGASGAASDKQDAPLVVTTGTTAKGSVKRGNTDSRAIDKLLQDEFGGKRPTVGGAQEPAVKPRTASWVAGLEEDAPAPATKQSFGIPSGTEIPVRLLKPLDSRTTGSGPAVAKLSRAFALRGAVVLPSGTMVYGTATPGPSGRFDVHFKRLKLPDGREFELDAQAFDREDNKPGLQATTRTKATSAPKSNLAGKVVKGTANAALGLIPGDGPVDLAKSVGQTVINHEEGSNAQAEDVLMLEAPADFVLFVREPL